MQKTLAIVLCTVISLFGNSLGITLRPKESNQLNAGEEREVSVATKRFEFKPHPGSETAAILLFDHFNMLDVYGPMEMLINQKSSIRFVTCSMEKPNDDGRTCDPASDSPGLTYVCQKPGGGPWTVADFSMANCPTDAKILFVPGAGLSTINRLVANENTARWLGERIKTSAKVVAIGNGMRLVERANAEGLTEEDSDKIIAIKGGTSAIDLTLKFLGEVGEASRPPRNNIVEAIIAYTEYTPGGKLDRGLLDGTENPTAKPTLPKQAHYSVQNPSPTMAILLYNGIEVLDTFGPIQMFQSAGIKMVTCTLDSPTITCCSKRRQRRCFPCLTEPPSAKATSHWGPLSMSPWVVSEHQQADCPDTDFLFVPGGAGTMRLFNEKTYAWLRNRTRFTKKFLTVCTGSWLVAMAGLLKDTKATTNKNFWCPFVDWNGPEVQRVKWQSDARWVSATSGDIEYWTSSGVSAGTDMSLAFIQSLNEDGFGAQRAHFAAAVNNYEWNDDKANDPFAKVGWTKGSCRRPRRRI
jgi:putative intracellular protease/amidase